MVYALPLSSVSWGHSKAGYIQEQMTCAGFPALICFEGGDSVETNAGEQHRAQRYQAVLMLKAYGKVAGNFHPAPA